MPNSAKTLQPIFQVHEFNQMVSLHLQRLGELVIEGEISQMRVSQGKWLFMTIKDDLASVEVFAPAFRLSTLNMLEEGMKVHVYGQASLYQKTGRFTIQATQIVPAGEGALKLAYEKLKQKLDQEGLFDPARKRVLPKFINKIGLITAKDSRAYSDFIKILQERIGGIQIYFYPVQVQGKESVTSLLQAFQYFQSHDLHLDALVMIRGGGSLEDLLSFNDEMVARAVFASKIPVISGIGHEDDIALTDLVADLRASTPSNAAELLMADRDSLNLEIKHLKMRLSTQLKEVFQAKQQQINQSLQTFQRYFVNQQEVVVNLSLDLERFLTIYLERFKLKQSFTLELKNRLSKSSTLSLENQAQRLSQLSRLLSSYDYQKVLARGFSLARNQKGQIIKSSQQLKPQDQVEVQLATGSFISQVQSIKN